MGKLALATSELDHLFRAYRDVRKRIQKSLWPHLAMELSHFEEAPVGALRDLQARLRTGAYRFSPKPGYAKKKSGGSRRGITVHGLEDRIVQRAILNLLQSPKRTIQEQLGELPRWLDYPMNFAGVPGRGVPEAITMAVTLHNQGAQAYALSDIKEFFPNVPRADVVSLIRVNVSDDDFTTLFQAALETEIANMEDIQPWLHLFPIGETGIAQGSLLSVVVANLSLRHFDSRLNQGTLKTIRYLDDFAIFGPDLLTVKRGFQEAQEELSKFGMTCYEPGDGSQKAFQGLIARGYDFLGCRIHPDGIAPGRASKRKLISEISATIRETKTEIQAILAQGTRRRSEAMYLQSLAQIDRKLRGWGDAYQFVTNRVAFTQIDTAVDRLLGSYASWFHLAISQASPREKRRALGVALLADTPARKPR